MRSPPCTRSLVPGITSIDGTPNKRLRPASNDDSVFEDQMCSKIETLISKSFEKEMEKIVESLKTSIKKLWKRAFRKVSRKDYKA